MLTHLLESRPARTPRRLGGAAGAVMLHYAAILGVMYTSAQAATVRLESREERVAFVEPTAPKPAEPPPLELAVALLPARVPQVLVAPVDIPGALPDIDLGAPRTVPEEFAAPTPVPRGRPAPVDATKNPEPAVFLEFQVERPVRQAANSAMPAYPDILRQAGVEGEVLVSFVVDTLGRADLTSLRVVRATHELFALAVKSALPRMRFIPAEQAGRRVPQLVHQPFSFSIVK